MLSLVLPYWQRQLATDQAMTLLMRHYSRLDMEVIVVDDGSPVAYRAPQHTPWPVRVIRLPDKAVALNPCVPINVGAAAANGHYIAISNPEILHTKPVLDELLHEAMRGDPWTYALAACWSPDKQQWHCHSTLRRRDDSDVGSWLPEGAGYHFLAVMSRYIWDASGGFDEAYRDGAGYDDPDFVRRVHKAGAKFVIRDDLVVTHPRSGAKAEWPAGAFQRNRKLFLSKWDRLR